MIYNIFFTDISKKELRQIYLYIKINLESPFTAIELIKRIIKAIQDLIFMPNRFPIYKKLYDEILNRLVKDKMNYIMIDEVQNIEKFEKALDSLYIKDKGASDKTFFTYFSKVCPDSSFLTIKTSI